MTRTEVKRIKTLASYAAHARWNMEVADEPLGWLARCQVADIPSPYSSGPTKMILDWNGRAVIIFETSHKRYEIFEVPADMKRFATDEEAIAFHIETLKSEGKL